MPQIFLFLNKRCFNGLYRENSKGLLNVPFRLNNCSIFCPENISELHKLFSVSNYKFTTGSYIKVFDQVAQNDILYIDPPYYPSGRSKFTQYHSSNFTIEDQKELAFAIRELDKRNRSFILSNSPCDEIKELYEGFEMKEFQITRSMRNARGISNSNSGNNEIIITNIF